MSFSTKQIYDLDNAMSANQNVSLGTTLNAALYGGITTPATGSVDPMAVIRYITAPALQTATGTKAAFTLLVGAQAGITAGITQPDYPRIVTVKGNDGNVTGNVVVHGTNFADAVITETIAANGTSEVLGTKAFKTVTSIDYPAYAVAGTETISIGRGIKIGFPIAISNTALVVAKNFNGSVDAGTVTASTTVEGSIYAVAGTMNGVKLVELMFLAP